MQLIKLKFEIFIKQLSSVEALIAPTMTSLGHMQILQGFKLCCSLIIKAYSEKKSIQSRINMRKLRTSIVYPHTFFHYLIMTELFSHNNGNNNVFVPRTFPVIPAITAV